MGQKVHAVAHRLGSAYQIRSKKLVDTKHGLGLHRGGWPTTRYRPTRKESRESLKEVERIRSAVSEWLAYEETYVEISPCEVIRYSDRREIYVQVYGLGRGLVKKGGKARDDRKESKRASDSLESGKEEPLLEMETAREEREPDGLGSGPLQEGGREELQLGLERAVGRIGLSLPWSVMVGEVEAKPFASAAMTAREDGREDTSRVSGRRRAQLRGLARTTPVSPGLATARARYLEDLPSHKTVISQVKRLLDGMVAESRSPAGRLDGGEMDEGESSLSPGHGGSDHLYTPLTYGFEVVFQGTFDGSRRTMKEVVAGGKRKRRSITTPVSYGRSHAKTKTGTRGVRVYVAYY